MNFFQSISNCFRPLSSTGLFLIDQVNQLYNQKNINIAFFPCFGRGQMLFEFFELDFSYSIIITFYVFIYFVYKNKGMKFQINE